jgi:hypothetical protein
MAIRSREGTLLVSKELSLHHLARKRRNVDRQELAIRDARPVVDRSRDELLAGATLPCDEDSGRGRCDLLHEIEDPAHRHALSDDSLKPEADRHIAA